MDIFEELGLHRYINAQDTFTTYGASCMPAASLRAMREIASSCVELAEVQAKTGDLRPPRAACPCGHGRLRSTGQYAGQRGRHC